ncbi:MAG: LysR family transcriptional regulator [Candidatus Methylomirabilota bacterium]|nr:MAG: LysR family transcriptional regulator [candidate division NC10 bacterium]
MTFHQLRVFLAVARRGSYSRAAEELLLSQPAVSAQVRELERTLEATFFERVGRTIVLTEAGRELLPYAERICALTDEAKLAMQELDGLKRGRIAVAAVSTAGAYVLPSLLGAFQTQHPGITINLEVINRALARDRLVHNEVDLVVMGRPPEEVPHVAEPFLSDEIVVVAAPSHPLATVRRIPVDRLAQEVFIAREVGSGTRLNADEFFRQQGVKPRVELELGDNSAVKEAVAAGLGIALLSRHVLRMELALKRLMVLDVQGLPLRRQWFVVHREDKHLSRAAIAFKAFLLTSAEAVLASVSQPRHSKGHPHR